MLLNPKLTEGIQQAPAIPGHSRVYESSQCRDIFAPLPAKDSRTAGDASRVHVMPTQGQKSFKRLF